MAKKNTTFTVCVKIQLDTDVDISAESFEEALERARALEVTDIVSFDGNYNDGDLTVTGVFSN